MRRISIRLTMERASNLVTRAVARRFGERFPFYYVMEYPKSGGSWLADMIADYLQIPRPVGPVFPIGFQCVLHGHWRYSPRYRRVFYLYRDGRDVVVSLYFRVVQNLRHPPYKTMPAYYARRFPELVDPAHDPEDIRALLPRFIDRMRADTSGTPLDWSKHVAEWAFGRPHVVTVSYEALLSGPEATLARIISVHSDRPIDRARLAATVHKYSFEQQTGRKAGTEARGAILRKGVAGDWRNHFTREAGEVFARHFGETLIRLGYESDRRWYEKLPER